MKKFNRYDWNAPIYESVEETLIALEKFGIKGKTIKNIFAIGVADDYDLNELQHIAYQAQRKAGIQPELIWSNKFDLEDSVLIPFKLQLCEPLILEFTDGNTLDLRPLPGGRMQMAMNSIPKGMCNGLNHSNCDVRKLFDIAFKESCSDREIGWISVDDSTENVEHCGASDGEVYRYHDRTHTRQEYCFDCIEIRQKQNCWYEVFIPNRSCELSVGQIKETLRNIEQIRILDGFFGCEYINIGPVRKSDAGQNGYSFEWFCDDVISISEDYFTGEIIRLLHKYLDTKTPFREAENNCGDGFDHYGWNFYKPDDMAALLADLQRYVDAPPETEKVVKLDFYRRFIQRMRGMLAHCPDAESILFLGP